MDSYFIHWVVNLYSHVIFLHYPSVSKWGPLQPAPLSFLAHSLHSSSTSLCSGSQRCSRLILYSPCPQPKYWLFLQGALVPFGGERVFLQLRGKETEHLQGSSFFPPSSSILISPSTLIFPTVLLSIYDILEVDKTDEGDVEQL